MPLVGFQPTVPTGEQPQFHTLDRVATGISKLTSFRGIFGQDFFGKL
jgi:hypothetical protein